MALGQHDGLAAVARLGDDLHASQALQEAAEPRPEEGMVRGQQKTQRLHGLRRTERYAYLRLIILSRLEWSMSIKCCSNNRAFPESCTSMGREGSARLRSS